MAIMEPLLKSSWQGTANAITHNPITRGQGQHQSGVDASKCHVWRGRLPGDLFTKYSSIVVVKAEEAYNV